VDSYAAVLPGGKNGPIIKPGNLRESELFSRDPLPASDDTLMPPSTRPAMPVADVTVLKPWIEAGASGMQSVSRFKDGPPAVAKVKFEEVHEAALQKARAPQAALVKHLQERYAGVSQCRSRMSVNLEINASLLGTAFGDPDLRQVSPLADKSGWADLSDTTVTDASARVLLSMKKLWVLHLNPIAFPNSTLEALGALRALRS